MTIGRSARANLRPGVLVQIPFGDGFVWCRVVSLRPFTVYAEVRGEFRLDPATIVRVAPAPPGRRPHPQD